jgi:hypothetical protein
MLVVEVCCQPYLPQGKRGRQINSRGTRIADAHENHPELDFTDMNQPFATEQHTLDRQRINERLRCKDDGIDQANMQVTT